MKVLDIIKFIWLLPATIVAWLVYILPLILTKQVKYIGKYSPIIWKFRLTREETWYSEKWRDWYGWSGPCVILYRDELSIHDDKWVGLTLKHEGRHCEQQTWLGAFFYLAYGLNCLYIYLAKKDKHVYHDNWFEKDARRAAGQKVEITRDEWMHGPKDRIPWF